MEAYRTPDERFEGLPDFPFPTTIRARPRTCARFFDAAFVVVSRGDVSASCVSRVLFECASESHPKRGHKVTRESTSRFSRLPGASLSAVVTRRAESAGGVETLFDD